MTALSDRQLIDAMYFQTFGQLLHSVYKQGYGPVREYRLKSLQEQEGSSGGFLVPAQVPRGDLSPWGRPGDS